MQVYVGPATSAAQAQVVLPLVHSHGGVDGLDGGDGLGEGGGGEGEGGGGGGGGEGEGGGGEGEGGGGEGDIHPLQWRTSWRC